MAFIKDIGREDVFGNIITEVTNILNIEGQHPFSQERWRYLIENTSTGELEPELIQYGNTTGYTDNDDYKTIEPSVDTVHVLKTAELFQHTIGIESFSAIICGLNQSLQTGEKLVVGVGDPDLVNDMANASGWFLEFEPEIADDEAYLSIYREGSIISNGGNRKLVSFQSGVSSSFKAYGFSIAGDERGACTASEGVASTQSAIARVDSVVPDIDSFGPRNFDGEIVVAIQAGSTSTGLAVNVGGVARRAFGKEQPTFRPAEFGFEDLNVGSSNTWVPIAAIRIDTSRAKIRADLESLEFLRYTENNDVNLIAKAFNETTVEFTGGAGAWEAPDGMFEENTIIQVRTDIDTIFDTTGSAVSTTDNPGGYILARSTQAQGTGVFGGAAARVRSTRKNVRRSLYDGDIMVILANADGIGDVSFEMGMIERW